MYLSPDQDVAPRDVSPPGVRFCHMCCRCFLFLFLRPLGHFALPFRSSLRIPSGGRLSQVLSEAPLLLPVQGSGLTVAGVRTHHPSPGVAPCPTPSHFLGWHCGLEASVPSLSDTRLSDCRPVAWHLCALNMAQPVEVPERVSCWLPVNSFPFLEEPGFSPRPSVPFHMHRLLSSTPLTALP